MLKDGVEAIGFNSELGCEMSSLTPIGLPWGKSFISNVVEAPRGKI